MSKNIDISIIIPLYNGKAYIKETVESLFGIRHSKEIVIVDDGSKDDSFDYCRELFSGYDFVKLYRKNNGGIVDTRNYGISKASGNYVMFCDQDDIAIPGTIDKALEKDDDCIIWSTQRLIDNDVIVPCDTVINDAESGISEIRNVLIPQMLTNRSSEYVSYMGHVWAGIFRRDIIDTNNIRFKKFVDIEDDYLFVFDFLCVSKKISFIKDAGYIWRFNRKSETFRIKYVDNMLNRYGQFYDYLCEKCKQIHILDNNYITYSVQNRTVMCIENCFQYFNRNIKEKRNIRKYYKANRLFFKTESIESYVKRRKRIFWLLRRNMFDAATFYVFADSIVRRVVSIFRQSS